MKLNQAVDRYVRHKRNLGMTFRSTTRILRAFCKRMGDINVDEASDASVNSFIRGTGPVTSNLHTKVSALRGFYNYLLARELVSRSPVPPSVPKQPEPQKPHIYSREELRQLLQAAGNQKGSWLVESSTMRALLLLLYASALRAGEAIRLTLEDVDLDQRVLMIRETKFHKSRLVPLGTDLTNVIRTYKESRRHRFDSDPKAPFLITRRGHSLTIQLAENSFRRVCISVGLRRIEGNRFWPRLHDLRHTFAVHRLIAWYHQGADVQRLLPHLSTYLGHVNIKHTQRYLTMTPELLSQASRQFEKYASREMTT